MGQLTEQFVRDQLRVCNAGQFPPLTVHEAQQLLRAWLTLFNARQIASDQAEDEALWCIAENIVEAHLQQQLRRLTAAIEG